MTLVPGYGPFGVGRTGAVGAAAEWLSGLATGTLAAALCAIAIALVGFMMLLGRVPVRSGFRTVIGCFILIGAPVLANALMELSEHSSADQAALAGWPAEQDPRVQVPSNFDPYAGASLRQD